jgi:hypothetical protein
VPSSVQCGLYGLDWRARLISVDWNKPTWHL